MEAYIARVSQSRNGTFALRVEAADWGPMATAAGTGPDTLSTLAYTSIGPAALDRPAFAAMAFRLRYVLRRS
jgi:hypothetical protein